MEELDKGTKDHDIITEEQPKAVIKILKKKTKQM